MSFSKLFIVIAGIIAGSAAMAQSLQLGQPSYGGNGCPGGSASTIISPDSQELSILFDQYIAEAGGSTSKTSDRKSCNLAVPVRVPQGWSVAVFKVDYRGYTEVPPGGSVRLEAEYFWAGARGPKTIRLFSVPHYENNTVSKNYTVTDNLVASTLVWSGCGAEVNLRVNSNILAKTNSSFEQTTGTVDSVDVSSSLVYHLQWKRCF